MLRSNPASLCLCLVPLSVLVLSGLGAGCSYDFTRSWQAPLPELGVRRDLGVNPPPVDAAPPGDVAPSPDATVDRGPSGSDDSQPSPPKLCYTGGLKATAVPCPAGWTAIAGGVECPGGLVTSAAQPSGGGWRTACVGGAAPGFTETICATGSWPRVRQSSGSGAAKASCPGGTVVVGGGCECLGGGALVEHGPTGSADGWRCRCNKGGAGVEAVCADGSLASFIDRRVAEETWSNEGKVAASCSGGTSALAGGCRTGDDSPLLITGGLVDPPGWLCGFGDKPASVTVTAICVTDPLADCL